MDGGWIFVLFIAITIVVIVVNIILDRQRTAATKQLAANVGFTYRENASSHLPESVWHFDLFNKGRNRRIRNLIQGTQDTIQVSIGDYQYTTGSSKNKSTHRQTVVLIESDRLHLPGFLLAPENLFHKIGNLFGYHDIDFDSHPEFSHRYLLKGSDEASIRHVFHDGVLNFYQRYHGISTEGLGQIFIYYRQGRRVDPQNWKTLLNEALEVYEQFNQQFY